MNSQNSEFDPILDNDPNQLPYSRHGCTTAWLGFMIFINALVSVFYIFMKDDVLNNLPSAPGSWLVYALAILGLVNVLAAVLIMQWKRLGFFIFVATSIIILGLNLTAGLGVVQSAAGLVGVFILFGILQIKKDGYSTWEQLQ